MMPDQPEVATESPLGTSKLLEGPAHKTMRTDTLKPHTKPHTKPHGKYVHLSETEFNVLQAHSLWVEPGPCGCCLVCGWGCSPQYHISKVKANKQV